MREVYFEVPILFIVFNRLEETQKVFESIRLIKPANLYIAADGPRNEIVGELARCNTVRSWIINNIDWPCKVHTLFREANIGCGKAPAEAITWFFSQVEEGIILEDDCLPSPSFFSFCQELLTKYRDVEQISAISGNNFQSFQPMPIEADYYFSVFPSSWGWATWRRAWAGFDFTISKWNTVNKDEVVKRIFTDKKYNLWWKRKFDWIYEQQPQDMWDFQFHYHSMLRNQLAIIPKANLVSNIGHNNNGTHFYDPASLIANLPSYELTFPLHHPPAISRNYQADSHIQNLLFGEVEIVSNTKRIKRAIKRALQLIN